MQRREVTDVHANLPAVIRIYRAPPHADPDTRALELLNVILGQGESSRLNVAVVRRGKGAPGPPGDLEPLWSPRGARGVRLPPPPQPGRGPPHADNNATPPPGTPRRGASP